MGAATPGVFQSTNTASNRLTHPLSLPRPHPHTEFDIVYVLSSCSSGAIKTDSITAAIGEIKATANIGRKPKGAAARRIILQITTATAGFPPVPKACKNIKLTPAANPKATIACSRCAKCLKALNFKCGATTEYKVMITDDPVSATTITTAFVPGACTDRVKRCRDWRA